MSDKSLHCKGITDVVSFCWGVCGLNQNCSALSVTTFWNKRKNPTSKQSVSQTVNNKHNVKQHSIAPKTNTRNTEADGKEIQILHRRLLLSAYSEGERKDDTITRIVY